MSGWVNSRKSLTPLNTQSSNTEYSNNSNLSIQQKRFSFVCGGNNETKTSGEITPSSGGFLKRLSLSVPLKNEECKNISEVMSKSNPKYRKQLQKYFRIPSDQLVDHFFCAIKQVAMIYGRLYLTPHELCFYSKINGIVFRRIIPLSIITSVEKKNSSLIIPDAIEIFTSRDSIFFNRFESQIEAYNAIKNVKSKFNKNVKPESGSLSSSPSLSRNRSLSNIMQEGEGLLQKIISQVDSVKNLKDMMNNSSDQSQHTSSSPNAHHSPHLSPYSSSSPSISNSPQTRLDMELHRYFQLPESERVFEVSYCTLKKGVMQKGKLYLTQSFICYRALVSIAKSFSKLNCIQINYKDVVNAQLINLSSICPNAIQLSTHSHSFTIGSLMDRAQIFDALTKAIQSIKDNDRKVLTTPSGNNMMVLFKHHFISTNLLPPSELPSHWFNCTVYNPVKRRGNLYLTENFLCFQGTAYITESKEVIHYSTIVSIERKRRSKKEQIGDEFGDFDSSIRIFTSSSKFEFHEIDKIDELIQLITDNWKVKTITEKSLPASNNSLRLKKRYSLENYYFYLPNFYISKERYFEISDYDKAVFKSSEESMATVYVFPTWSENLCFLENELLDIRLLAEQFTLSSLELEEGMKIILSKSYTKKTNQANGAQSDQSPYLCWIVLAHSSQNFQIALAYCRRKFLAPFGDRHQDIVISITSSKRGNKSGMSKEIEEIVDSISPKISFQLDTSNIQYNLESLCFDYPLLQWCHKSKRYPDILVNSKLFIKSLFYQLELVSAIPSIQSLFPEIKTLIEPQSALASIQNYPERQCEDKDEWAARVGVYLSFGLQYFNEFFDLKKLVQTILSENALPLSTLETIKELINYMIHMREGKSASAVYENKKLEERIARSDFLYTVFSFNERFVKQLIDLNYFRYLISIDPMMYASFMISLLKNGETEELIYSVCTEMSTIILQNSIIRSHLIDLSVLSQLSVLYSSSNWIIICGAARAMVNITYNNEAAKRSLLQILPQIIQLISSHATPYSVLNISLLLLKNLCSVPDARAAITMNGGVKAVCSLLRSRQNQYDDLTSSILSAIWNLTDDGNRAMMVAEGVIQTVVQFLKTPQKEKENVILEKSLGCLIALAGNSEKNKVKIGKLGAISKIASLLSETSFPNIINHSLYLLIILCSVPENLEVVLQEQMVAIFVCLAHFGDQDTKSLANDLLQYVDPKYYIIQ